MKIRGLLLAVILVVSACGGDDGAASQTTFTAPTTTGADGGATAGDTETTAADTETTATTAPPAPSDGITWARVAHDDAVFGGEEDQIMKSVTAGGPGLVAVGEDRAGVNPEAAAWTSSDGITWSRVPHDDAVFGGDGTQTMLSMTAGGPGLVAVGGDSHLADANGAVWTSADGITWSRVPHDEAVFGPGDDGYVMLGVTAGGPGLVAVGWFGFADRDAVVWTSGDGITWSRVPHDEAVFGGEGNQEMLSVTAGGPGLVAVGIDHDVLGDEGRDAAVWTSADGVTWSRVPHDDAVFGPGNGWVDMLSVAAGGPGLVAVGTDLASGAAVWTSADGVTWSRVPHDEANFAGEMLSVTVGGPGLVAVGRAGAAAAAWTSADGITWFMAPHDEAVFGGEDNQEMLSVTVGGPGLVAVGSDGPIGDLDGAVWVAEG